MKSDPSRMRFPAASAQTPAIDRTDTRPHAALHDSQQVSETFPRIALTLLTVCCFLLLFCGNAHAQSKTLTITGVAADTDSVKVRFQPVPGAADYRIYDVNNPTSVKYAGLLHVFAPWGYHFKTDSNGHPLIPDQLVQNTSTVTTPSEMDEPALEIELNGLTIGTHYTLMIEAVDALGPVPGCSMYDA